MIRSIAAIFMAVFAITSAQAADKDIIVEPTATLKSTRVALVIGINHYTRGTGSVYAPDLTNPINDAQAMRDTLAKLGFTVVYGEDLGKDAFESALDHFEDRVKEADIALVYFSGHGSTFDDHPYLVPADATFDELRQAQRKLVRVEDVLSRLRTAKGVRIALFDACRDNAAEQSLKHRLAGTKSVVQSRGLARVPAPEGLIVMYAAQHLRTAADGDEKHSPFATALLKMLPTPGVNITTMLEDVARLVIASTHGEQKPELVVDLFDKFTLVETEPAESRPVVPTPAVPMRPQVPSAATVDPRIAEAALIWPSLANSSDLASLTLFSKHYEGTIFGSMAQTRIAEVKAAQKAEADKTTSPMKTEDKVALLPPKAGVPAIGPSTASTDTECDRLAGQRGDPDLPNGGIEFEDIDPSAAISACRDAVSRFPEVRRFVFQLGRAVDAGRNYEEAITLYRKAADLGSTSAMSNIGAQYEYGLGVERDFAEAMNWYRKAADLGNPWATYNIGVLIRDGKGVKQDYAAVVPLFRKAAGQGNAKAKTSLGALYEGGRGVPRNYAQAKKLYMEAAALGDRQAVKNLKELCRTRKLC